MSPPHKICIVARYESNDGTLMWLIEFRDTLREPTWRHWYTRRGAVAEMMRYMNLAEHHPGAVVWVLSGTDADFKLSYYNMFGDAM